MVRRLASCAVVVAALALVAPAGAQARTACPSEQSTPTLANSPLVSDAVFCLTNQIRASYGLAPFHRDARLDVAARLHSADMAGRNYFAHTTPEGLDPSARAAAQGYVPGVGENIAAGYGSARSVMVGWMASPGHCEHILSTARDIGVGTAALPRANYTQDFGDYDFRTSNAAAAGCPYKLDLDSLVTPDPASAPGPAAAGAPSVTQSAPVATAAPATSVDLRGLKLARTRLRASVRTGTTVSYRLSAPATVTFRVQRAAAGGRWRTLSSRLTDHGIRGANTLRFRARLNGHALAVGRYRLVAVARDVTGTVSPTRRVSFRVVRG